VRALVAPGWSRPTQRALWEETAGLKVEGHVAYPLVVPRARAGVGAQAFGRPHRLAALRLRGDRQAWMAHRGLGRLVGRSGRQFRLYAEEPEGHSRQCAVLGMPEPAASP
jgi:hypothetical protein